MLIDSHCHLDFPELSGRLPEILAAAAQAGVGRMVSISTLVKRFEVYRGLAEAHPEVYFSVGTHPHNADQEPDVTAEHLVALSGHPRCIAIGEAGLDYHYDKSPRDVQRRVLRTHIAAARVSGLPLVIHARDADSDMMQILVEESKIGPYQAVLHCFSSGRDLAMTGVALGFYVSFSGILTFKKSDENRAIAAEVPADRLLVETDAPYLAPEPHRGHTNEPAYVAHTARVLASLRGVSEDEIAGTTTDNFYRLFAKARLADAAHGFAAA